MKRSRVELTAEQVDAGRRMRECHGTSWYRIGRNLGCDPETIQRALDPGYDERRRASRAKRRQTLAERGKRLTRLGSESFEEPKPKPKRSEHRPKAERMDYESNAEEASARRRLTKQDDALIDAMTKAVRQERESCPIGVDTRPSTHDPRFVSPHGDSRSLSGSSAQMCADFA